VAATPCPGNDTIAELVCHRLGDAKATELEAHIADCAACRLLVGTLAAGTRPNAIVGAASAPAPTTHDRYERREELARGGMGRISIATDRLLHRDVAIKEVLAPDAALAARFERELALTARLQHPSIVSIYDAGTWSDGEPFYVMRLVNGEPLDRIVARHHTPAARIGLLPHGIAMVDALAYAHSQRILHRDLKPQNVLVGDFGETVVIDWGLAKDLRAVDPEPEPAAVTAEPVATAAGVVVGTPAFMSPEQASGAPVDERADVYALGAVLYYLLAGVPPHGGATASQVVLAVRSRPPRPLAELADGMPGDLLAIVDKAMAPRPADRYATATELAADLKRFQRGQLVGAYRYSRRQLAMRWLRRHRAAVIVAATAVVALGVVAAISVRNVLTEKQRAEENRSDADQLMTFMLTDLHDRLKPIGKLELLDSVADKAREYFAAHPDPHDVQDLHNRLLAVSNLGEVLDARGDRDAALEQFRSALALADQLADAEPTDAAEELVASCHGRLAHVLFEQQETAHAGDELATSLAIDRRLAAAHPDDAAMSRGLMFDLDTLGEVLEAQNDTDGALARYRESLAVATRFAHRDPSNTQWPTRVAHGHAQLSSLLHKRGDSDGAIVEGRAALAEIDRLTQRDPEHRDVSHSEWQTIAINVHLNVGQIMQQRDLGAARDEYRAANAIAAELAARDASNAIWQQGLAMTQAQLGDVLLAEGNLDGALQAFRSVVATDQALVARSPGNVAAQRELMIGEGHLGEVNLSRGDLPAALDAFRAAKRIAHDHVTADPSNTAAQRDLAAAGNNVGLTLLKQGDNGAALDEFRAAVAVSQRLAESDPQDADVQHELCIETFDVGDALLAEHDEEAAIREYRAAGAIASALSARDASDQDALRGMFDGHDKIGQALVARGKHDEAIRELEAALAVAEQLSRKFPDAVEYAAAIADTHGELGDALRARGDVAEGTAEYRAALAVAAPLAARAGADADAQHRVTELRRKLRLR
jgi:tetratricopeptide (TPR) repeat protein